jgi:Domain of unknown function (DUF5659)
MIETPSRTTPPPYASAAQAVTRILPLKWHFETDIYRAAFLLSKNVRLENVVPNERKPGQLVFRFDNRDDMATNAIRDFLNGDAEVDPRAFVHALEDLKTTLFQKLENRKYDSSQR